MHNSTLLVVAAFFKKSFSTKLYEGAVPSSMKLVELLPSQEDAAIVNNNILRRKNRRPRGASPKPVLTSDVLDTSPAGNPNTTTLHPFSGDLSEGSEVYPPDESAWDYVDDVEVAQETLKDIYRDFQAVRKGKWHKARPEFMRDFDFISRLPKGPALDYTKLGVSLPEPPPTCEGRTLFIDLDETLAHTEMASLDDPNTKAIIKAVQKAAESKEPPVDAKKQLLPNLIFSSSAESSADAVALVYFRPYVREFLRLLSHRYQLVCYTASLRAYANTILNALDVDRRLSHRLYREHCTQYSTTDIYFKDLHGTGRDLSKCVVLDNRVISFGLNISNGVLISSFLGSPNDNDLLCLLPFLLSLSRVRDIRATLRAHYGLESAIAMYEGSSWQKRLNRILSDPNSCTDNVTQVFEQLQAEGIRAEEAQRRRRQQQKRQEEEETRKILKKHTKKRSDTTSSNEQIRSQDHQTIAMDYGSPDPSSRGPGGGGGGAEPSSSQCLLPEPSQSEEVEQQPSQRNLLLCGNNNLPINDPVVPTKDNKSNDDEEESKLLTSSRTRTRRRSSDRRSCRRAGSKHRPAYNNNNRSSPEPTLAQVLNRPGPKTYSPNLQMVPQSVGRRPILTRSGGIRRNDHPGTTTTTTTTPTYQEEQQQQMSNITPLFVPSTPPPAVAPLPSPHNTSTRPPSPAVFWRHETPYVEKQTPIRNHSAGGGSSSSVIRTYSPPPLDYRPTQQGPFAFVVSPHRSISWQGGGGGPSSSLRKTSPPPTYLIRHDNNRCLQGSSLAARNNQQYNANASLWLRGGGGGGGNISPSGRQQQQADRKSVV